MFTPVQIGLKLMIKRDMTFWVVTGPIASGKSTLIEYFRNMDIVCIDADKIGHELLNRPDIKNKILTDFGNEVVSGNEIDRQVLGDIVFADKDKLQNLNSIIHPELVSEINSKLLAIQTAEKDHSLAILDAAVYFQLTGLLKFDLVISVVADSKIRLQRVLDRDTLPIEQAIKRIESQSQMYEDYRLADVVVENNGSPKELLMNAEKLFREHYLAKEIL